MKLIVQIPCYNEQATLPLVVQSIPRTIAGVDEVRVLVIDDGSTDRTREVAHALGVDYLVAHRRNFGLAAAFQSGLDACLELGADLIVTTDGDNQYPQQDIPRLIQPILDGQADIVVADRQVHSIAEFPWQKRVLQKLGSWTVRHLSGAPVADAPSGFRAFSRAAAERMNVLTSYSHTLETLIQAGRHRLVVANVPVRTNPKLRESRLMRGLWDYVVRSTITIMRAYAMYQPLKTFFFIGLAVLLLGVGFSTHWAYYRYAIGGGEGKLQSMVFAAALFGIGFQIWVMGLLASLIGVNRRQLEQVLWRVKRLERAHIRQGRTELSSGVVGPGKETKDPRVS